VEGKGATETCMVSMNSWLTPLLGSRCVYYWAASSLNERGMDSKAVSRSLERRASWMRREGTGSGMVTQSVDIVLARFCIKH
jgi:hypothetical protein